MLIKGNSIFKLRRIYGTSVFFNCDYPVGVAKCLDRFHRTSVKAHKRPSLQDSSMTKIIIIICSKLSSLDRSKQIKIRICWWNDDEKIVVKYLALALSTKYHADHYLSDFKNCYLLQVLSDFCCRTYPSTFTLFCHKNLHLWYRGKISPFSSYITSVQFRYLKNIVTVGGKYLPISHHKWWSQGSATSSSMVIIKSNHPHSHNPTATKPHGLLINILVLVIFVKLSRFELAN